jgi:hypothetical protein
MIAGRGSRSDSTQTGFNRSERVTAIPPYGAESKMKLLLARQELRPAIVITIHRILQLL